MSGETLSNLGYLPTVIERQELFNLMQHSREWAMEEQAAASPNADLYAMVDVGNRYSFRMPETSKRHLRRMIVLQSELVADISHDMHESLRTSIQLTAGAEKSQFNAFREDLTNMTQSWKCALEDVFTLLGALDMPDEE